MHRGCIVCVLVVDFDVEEIMEEFTMGKKGMTNDIDKIREITGYEPGKAFIGCFDGVGVETYGVDAKGEPVVYDISSKNFHIFPSDLKISDEILESKVRKYVYDSFIDYCKNTGDFKVVEYKKELQNIKPDEMVVYKRRGSVGGIKKKDRKLIAKGLFRYIPFYYHEKWYNINFMRFYIDKDNKVNCIFKQIQFDRTMKKYVNEDGICYPKTYQNHVKKLDKLIQDNKGKNFCYNPPVAYDDTEAIVKEFVNFIKKCEGYDTK